MAKPRLDYCAIWDYLQAHSVPETSAHFGATEKAITMVKRIGEALLGRKLAETPLSNFSPRELMMELANRGYRGRLTYQQVIDISNF